MKKTSINKRERIRPGYRPLRNVMRERLKRRRLNRVSPPNQFTDWPAGNSALDRQHRRQTRGDVKENVNLLLSQRLKTSARDLREENDRHPFRRLANPLPRD